MATETGGPAFPETGERGKAVGGEGMTMRDYFAAKAMQGVLGNIKGSFGTAYEAANLYLARASYAIADAMIKAREEQ